MKKHRQTLQEMLLLLAAAAALGFAYTFVTRQGFFGGQSPDAGLSPSNAGPEMIALATAKELFGAHTAVFVDARHSFEYEMGHIPGAVNVSRKDFESDRARLRSVHKDSLLVVYCDGAECNSSIDVAVKLTEAGFTDVKIFFGGWEEWKAGNLPVEK